MTTRLGGGEACLARGWEHDRGGRPSGRHRAGMSATRGAEASLSWFAALIWWLSGLIGRGVEVQALKPCWVLSTQRRVGPPRASLCEIKITGLWHRYRDCHRGDRALIRRGIVHLAVTGIALRQCCPRKDRCCRRPNRETGRREWLTTSASPTAVSVHVADGRDCTTK